MSTEQQDRGRHTPGPWRVDGPSRVGEVRIVAPYKPQCSYLVALASPDCPDDATRDANAQLIAAAPSMYTALRAMLRDLRESRDTGACSRSRDAQICDLAAAIRKAEGGAT